MDHKSEQIDEVTRTRPEQGHSHMLRSCTGALPLDRVITLKMSLLY